MSFYANPAVTIYAYWYCSNCVDTEVVDPQDDGSRITSDHRCHGYEEDEDES